MTWTIGDRVLRRIDVFDCNSRLRHGTVTRRYSCYSSNFGLYPELYEVAWDNEETEHGFLPHGIDRETD